MFLAVVAPAQGTVERNRPSFQDDEISLVYEFVWGERAMVGSFVPIRIEVDNPLRDDRGVVTVSSGSYRMQYPIEMPSKALRSFIAYVPVSSGYSETTITLACGQVSINAEVDPLNAESMGAHNVALVSDSPSLLTFLRAVTEKPKPGQNDPSGYYSDTVKYHDFSVLPGRAPDRSIGYDGFDIIVLGEGAERLTDAEVLAIQRYVLRGGAVLFIGGAIAPILKDARWQAFLPGSDPQPINIPGSRTIAKLGGSPLTDEMTVTRIRPYPGTSGLSEDGVPIVWYRPCGLGLAVYWAFDPFQAPVRNYVGRTRIVTDTLKALGHDAQQYLSQAGMLGSAPQWDYYSSPTSSYPATRVPSLNEPDQAGGVFRVTMPDTSTVFLILALYFVVVVPVNFVVLAKLGRGQLAWVTSPVIGLVFAGVFFSIARGLYGASLSRATSAVLIAHQGAPTAVAVGHEQMFFPAGGSYNLQLKGMESVTTISDYGDYYSYGRSTDTGFSDDLYDTGEVVAPGARVSNLAFREMQFQQALEWPYKLPVRLTLTENAGKTRAKGSLTNDTPYELSGVSLSIGRRLVVLGEIKSGETREFDELLPPETGAERSYMEVPVRKGQVVLLASVPGLALGSPLGKESGQGARLIYSYSTVSGEVLGS